MKFAEFQATGRDVADLNTIPHIAAQGVEGLSAGRVYHGDLYIEGTAADGYSLTLGNAQFSAELETLEHTLYAWAAGEGYLIAESINANREVQAYVNGVYYPGRGACPEFVRLLDVYPNLRIDWTGGNCRAFAHPFDDGGYLWITDDASLPDDTTTEVYIGAYDSKGEPIEAEQFETVPLAEVEARIDAMLAAHKPDTTPPDWQQICLDALSKEWADYCSALGLECRSADEFLRENEDKLTAEQRRTVSAFILQWERVS